MLFLLLSELIFEETFALLETIGVDKGFTFGLFFSLSNSREAFRLESCNFDFAVDFKDNRIEDSDFFESAVFSVLSVDIDLS